jgi:hypothetical protein
LPGVEAVPGQRADQFTLLIRDDSNGSIGSFFEGS